MTIIDHRPAKVQKVDVADPSSLLDGPWRRTYPRFWVEGRQCIQGDKKEPPLSNKEIKRLCNQLEQDPQKLNEDEQDHLCRFLSVDEIISLALKALPKEKTRDWFEPLKDGEEPIDIRIAMALTEHPNKLTEAELRLLYEGMPEFVDAALISCKDRSDSLYLELYDLHRVLPYKLFAHVFFQRTGIRLFGSHEGSNFEKEPRALGVASTPTIKRETEGDVLVRCGICLKNHHGHYDCPYLIFVPKGESVGPDFMVICKACGVPGENPAGDCRLCGREGGRAVHKWCPICDKYGDCEIDDINHRKARRRMTGPTREIEDDSEV